MLPYSYNIFHYAEGKQELYHPEKKLHQNYLANTSGNGKRIPLSPPLVRHEAGMKEQPELFVSVEPVISNYACQRTTTHTIIKYNKKK